MVLLCWHFIYLVWAVYTSCADMPKFLVQTFLTMFADILQETMRHYDTIICISNSFCNSFILHWVFCAIMFYWLFLCHYQTPMTSMTTIFNILPLWHWWQHLNILPLWQQWQRITCYALAVTILIENFLSFFFLTTSFANISPLLRNLALCFSSSC